MESEQYVDWVSGERRNVEAYLEAQGIAAPAVGPWPAFDMAPHFAIWAVESKTVGGTIGWWAFSGDCPTDYVSEDGACHPRNALRTLLANWRGYISIMKRGRQPLNARFQDEANLAALAELLETRVAILDEWLADDDLWEDR